MSPKSLLRITCIFALALALNQKAAAQTSCNPIDLEIAPSFDIGQNVSGSVMADFNGDGKPDAAVVNLDRRTVSVVYGDGYGGFSPPRAFPTVTNGFSIAAADLNNDGKVDIVLGSGIRNEIGILINNGTGGFQDPVVYAPPTPFPNQGEYLDVKAGDFNGDGNADIAAIRFQSNRQLQFFLGNGQGAITYTSAITIGASEGMMEVGNLNGDNFSDVLVFGGGSGSRSINYMFGSASGTFSLTSGFFVTDFPVAFTIANFNNDSNPDFVVAFGANDPYVKPYYGGFGGTTFTPGTSVVTAPYFLPPTDIASADFDQDGIQDLVVGLNYHAVAVLYGRANGQFLAPIHWAVQGGARTVFTANLDADAKPDMVTVQQAFTPNNSLSVLRNLGNQSFGAPKPVLWGLSQISAADFNNDGRLDFASSRKSDFVSVSSVEVNLNTPAGLGIDMGVETPKALTQMTVGDFNGDGMKDAVTSHANNARVLAVYLGNGTGTLAPPVLTSLNVGFENVIAGKFNADGADDVFVVDSDGHGYSMLSNGNGTFTTAPNFPVTLQGSILKLLKGDFNEDGKLDLIISSGVVQLWLGDGTGQFTRSLVPIPNLADVVSGDFNGDGHLDLAGFDINFMIVGVPGSGSGQFGQVFSTTLQTTGDRRALVAGDFNLDGLSDLAFLVQLSEGKNLVVLPASPGPGWGAPVFYSLGGLGGYTAALFAADYNGDGKTDLGYNAESSRGIIYNRTGAGPCISVNDVSVTEGDTGTVSAAFTVSLSAASPQSVQVNYSVNAGTATGGDDVQIVAGRLDIPAGQTTATVNVPINGDLLDEFDEQFSVTLSSPASASITRGTGTGTIVDNDAEPTITISDVSSNEGAFSQQFVFNINLSAPSGKPISFRFATADGSAVAGSDYIAANVVRSITPGLTGTSFNVTGTGDFMFEPDETFLVNLSEPVNVSFADGQATGTIVNDDPVPTLTMGTGVVSEGDTGTTNASLNLQLTNPTYLPVTLSILTSDGTAIGNQDYVPSDNSVTIPAGVQSFTAQVQIRGDVINEPNETFFVNAHNIVNATVTQPQASVIIFDDDSTQFDLDGDGKADVGIFRPAAGEWWYQRSIDSIVRALRFGTETDKMVPADYTGDGRTDIAIWRPSTGQWFILRSENGSFYGLPFGADGDIPAPADYDNDGKADIAVFRPSTSLWYIALSTGGTRIEQFGSSEDKPAVADYDGDGRADVAIFRAPSGQWWINRSTGGVTALTFGDSSDKPVQGDYTGDGRADIAIWRPSTGEWFVLRSEDFSYYAVPFGSNGDVPSPGDYDGDGKNDLTVFRPSSSTWYSQRTTAGTLIQQFGVGTDKPIANAFVP